MSILNRIKTQGRQDNNNKKWYRSFMRPIEGCILNIDKTRVYNLQYSEIDGTYVGVEVDEEEEYTHCIIPIYNLSQREEGVQLLLISVYQDISKLVNSYQPDKVYKIFCEDKKFKYMVSKERRTIIFDDDEIDTLFKNIPNEQSITFVEED